MKKLNILILGRSGKMGQVIESELTTHTVTGPRKRSESIDFKSIDLCIDFSSPDFILSHIDRLKTEHIPLISGTTGLNEAQFSRLKDAAKSIPVFYASNFSIGIHAVSKVVQLLAGQIGRFSDIDIIEKHHSQKKDKPSGTALSIASAIQSILPGKEINQHSIRAGKIIGEHTIQFSLTNELIEIKHLAMNRSVFAAGAVAVIPFLLTKHSGFYTMSDFLNEGYQ
ncbi:MAG: hypothetical protein KDD94_08885 [Calditrichaeota bacterium]|nr:hypothetical protein [Calditrichota bacterium]